MNQLYYVAIIILSGMIIARLVCEIKGEDELLSSVIVSIFIAIGFAEFLNVSTLLVCMMIGITASNFAHNSNRALNVINKVTPPIFIAFFTLSGVDLNLGALKYAGLMGPFIAKTALIKAGEIVVKALT